MSLSTVDTINVVADLAVLVMSVIWIVLGIFLILWMEIKTGRNVFNQFHPVRLIMILTFILLHLTPFFTMPPIWELFETSLNFVIPIAIQQIACKLNITFQYISELLLLATLLFFLAHRISPKSTTNYEEVSDEEYDEESEIVEESEDEDEEVEEEEDIPKELEEYNEEHGIQQQTKLPPLKPTTIQKKAQPIIRKTISEKVAFAYRSYHALHFESPVKKNLFILTPSTIITLTFSLIFAFFMIFDFLLDTKNSRVLFILFSTQSIGSVGSQSDHVRACYVPVVPAIYQIATTSLFLFVYAATYSFYMNRIINLKLKHRMTRLQIFIMFFLILNLLVIIIHIILVVDVWSTLYVHLFSLLIFCLRSITSLCILIGYVILPVREAIYVQGQLSKGNIGYFSLTASDYQEETPETELPTPQKDTPILKEEDEEDRWTESEEDHTIDEGDTPSKKVNLGPSQTALRFAAMATNK